MSFTLITVATSSSAHKIKNGLNSDTVILGDYMDMPDFLLKAGKMIRLPNPASASYAHQMLTLCLDNDITAIYALQPEEAALLHEAVQLFNEFNIQILSTDEIQ